MSKSAEHAAEVEQAERDSISKATLDILKRIGNQPEFSEAWKTLLNAERSYLAGDIHNIIRDALAGISTKDLVDELSKREGVATYPIDPYIKYIVEDETGIYTHDTGPAHILVVID